MVEDDRTDHRKRADGPGVGTLSRRATLALLALGGVGGVTGTATAKAARPWKTDVDASGYALRNLGSLSMADSPTAITGFAGRNLSVDDAGVLNALGDGIAALDAGTDANRPPAGTPDRYYLATDTRLLYYDDGDGWVAVAGAGSQSTPLPEQHVESLRAKTASVEEVGASVYRTTNRVIYQNGEDPIPGDRRLDFDAVRFDQLGGFESNPGEFTAQTNGLYEVSATATTRYVGTSISISHGVRLFVNGQAVATRWTHPGTLGPLSNTVSDLLELQAGDVVRAEFVILSEEGVFRIVLLGGEGVTSMTVQKVG